MDVLIIINYAILAIVLSLFMMELGTAVIALSDYNKFRKRAYPYIAPIWEITGTFSIFYLVNLIATFPSIIPVIDNLYITPILLAAVFLIVRDAFLGYSEFINDKHSELIYSRIYGICTIVFLFLILSVLTSSITGAGVNAVSLTANMAAIPINPFNILVFLSVLCLVTFASSIFFNIRNAKLEVSTIVASIALMAYAIYAYGGSLAASVYGNAYYAIPAAISFILMAALYAKKSRYARKFVIPWLFISVLTFELLSYPSMFGGLSSITSYLGPEVSSMYLAIVTVAGGIFLAIAIGYFIYVHNLHGSKKKGY